MCVLAGGVHACGVCVCVCVREGSLRVSLCLCARAPETLKSIRVLLVGLPELALTRPLLIGRHLHALVVLLRLGLGLRGHGLHSHAFCCFKQMMESSSLGPKYYTATLS